MEILTASHDTATARLPPVLCTGVYPLATFDAMRHPTVCGIMLAKPFRGRLWEPPTSSVKNMMYTNCRTLLLEFQITDRGVHWITDPRKVTPIYKDLPEDGRGSYTKIMRIIWHTNEPFPFKASNFEIKMGQIQ